jgi:hypothetical protein
MKTIEVRGCGSCPFASYHDRSSAAWYCRITNNGQSKPDEPPEWCPLRTEDRLITLKKGDSGW